MSQKKGLNRRAFLRSAGFTALAGAVGTGTSVAAAAPGGTPEPPGGTFDFDTPYDRIGTDSVKWDQQIERFGADKIQVGMGIADMDFKAAPCITEARAERHPPRELGLPVVHEIVRRDPRQVEQTTLRSRHRSRLDRGLERRASRAHRRAQDVLASGQQGAPDDAGV